MSNKFRCSILVNFLLTIYFLAPILCSRDLTTVTINFDVPPLLRWKPAIDAILEQYSYEETF